VRQFKSFWLALALLGCGPKPPPATAQLLLPDKFLVVDWQVAERTALEAAAQRGVVAVKYDGKQVHVLPNCRAPGKYQYTSGVGPNPDAYALKDSSEVGARLPLYAITLGGEYATHQTLHIRTVTVGEWTSPLRVTRFDLPPECAGATHVVEAISVGAFELESAVSATAGAELGWQGIGAEASTDKNRHVLRRAGDHRKCATRAGAQRPPGQCDHPVRIELSPIADPTLLPVEEKLGGVWEGPGRTAVENGETVHWKMSLELSDPPKVGRCADVEYELEGSEPCAGYWVCDEVSAAHTMLRASEVLTNRSTWCETGAVVVMTVRGFGAASITYRGDYGDWADVQRPRPASP
jgi:hypothetical protein